MTILGKRYKIKYLDDNTIQSAYGSVKRGQGLILINKDTTPDQQAETLLHEVIHAVDEELLIGLEEADVARLAVGLYSAGLRFVGK
jgi:Zn-dependent peptidase ImmA (M78 family)